MFDNIEDRLSRRKSIKCLGVGLSAIPAVSGSVSAGEKSSENGLSDEAEKAFWDSLGESDSDSGGVSTNDFDSGGGSNDTVTVGESATLDLDYGEKYTSDDASSYQSASLTASYDTASNRLEARAYDYAGWGTFEAWTYLARDFTVEGDSSQTATITTTPDIEAELNKLQASSSLMVELIVEESGTVGARWDETVLSKSGTIDTYDSKKTDSMDITLEPGTDYTVVVRLAVSTTNDGAGHAHADVSTVNGGTEGIDASTIEVSF